MTVKTFSRIKKGDKISYCFDGNFTVTSVHQVEDRTVKITAKNSADGETLTLGHDDLDLMEMVSQS